jgi:hypothetical protein
MIRWSLILVSMVVALAAGCGEEEGDDAAPTSPTPTSTAPPTSTVSPTEPVPVSLELPVLPVSFGDYRDVSLLDPDGPRYAGPTTPQALEGVRIAPEIQAALAAPGVTEALLERGFVVVPGDMRLFHFAYQGSEYGGWPVFVTTDAGYHAWHLVFDKVLRTLEQEVLLPKLETLVGGLLEASGAQTAELAGTPLETDASRVEQLFQVAAAELGLPVTLGPLAAEEKALVDAHSAAYEPSPVIGLPIDYSLFTPRGHYTRNADLTRYFVAMSVLGQSAFCLPETTDCPGLSPARTAILAARMLTSRPELVELWQEIYEPTAFLVGFADDYTPLEMEEAAVSVTAAGLEDAAVFADDSVVTDIVGPLTRSRPVRISPDRASIRLMGTRFVIDSFVLDQLIYPYVGTADEPRALPSGLDLPAALGSDFAYGVLETVGETAYEGYDAQLRLLRVAIARRPPEAWGSTVYDAWLHALEPSFVSHGEAFPDFMRTDAWAAKAHQSGLGSYAELKHDTILYTKQAVAEGGDGLPIPPRRNWVEPETVVFARLAAAAELLRQGLEQRGLLGEEQQGLLRDTAELFSFLERIARDELAGLPISEQDNQRLTVIGGELESVFWRASDRSADGAAEIDQDAAIIADIASGGQGVLEVATGRIDRILVLVPNDDGDFQVAAGGVYSYYEFTSPPGTRLTDEEWRATLDAGAAPERPAWEGTIAPG